MDGDNRDEQGVAPKKPPRPIPAGWYPYQPMPGTKRYWDGDKWTDHYAPIEPRQQPVKATSAFTVARGVALGILAVIALLIVLTRIEGSNDDLECATENVERSMDGLPPLDCG